MTWLLSNDVEVNLARHEHRILSLEKGLERVEVDIRPLDKLALLIEMQIDQTADIKETMVNINENLSNLNHDVKHMKDNMNSMDGRVNTLESERFEEFRKAQQEQKEAKKRKVNLVYKIVGGVLTTVLTAAVLLWFGLN